MKLYNLVRNEVFKMIGKKRLYITLGIILVIIAAFAYGQYHSLDRTKDNLSKRIGIEATSDWKNVLQQQLIDIKRRMDSPYIDDDRRANLRVRAEQMQFYLDKNINPLEVSAVSFSTKFIEQSLLFLLPLLMIILSADIVSGELSGGTIKLLLVRGVSRWKILLSKYITIILLEALVMFFVLILTIGVSGIFFGYGGWTTPVVTGFKVVAGKLVTSDVVNVPQWKYLMMTYGLAYFVAVVVGSVSFMISTLVRSTAASIGIVLSTLIGGSLLTTFLEDWKLPRYFFTANLKLTDYISGSLHPIEGMNMAFSLAVLSAWILLSVVVSFGYFTKRDILV
ncbi:ABC transporter permease [Pseudobacteroides cellulosolvens]|uniref:ABC transporter permease n=1 Tax=Pseudobacteroides cellulosolvens TaxID=35825 RepID=UPI00056944DF|nr:ABC transporter permease [Pseudobacteroides cellulosolvens]